MDKTLAIAFAVVRDAIRRKVVWVIVLFAALLSLVAPSLPSYGNGVVSAVYREVAIALMFTAAVVVTLTLAATRIPSETERRTVFSVLARDVRRGQYLSGTWLGVFAVVGVVVLAFTAVALVVGAVVYGVVMWQLLEAALAVWFEMGVLAALTMLLTARFGVVTSTVGALVFLFVGHSVDSLWAAGAEGIVAPWYVPSLSVFDVINPVAHGSGVSVGFLAGMTGAFLAWVAVLLLGASALFERRDL